MPSANSAKIEKTPSPETNDFIKQCISLVEKKVRNLEKRKAKLDGYKALSATKELISDQLAALSKYDQVVEMLEQSKEIQKNVQTIHQEFIKQAKKNAKREQQERQQHEVQRIKEVLLLQDILNNMGTDEIRQDFLNGTNGAIKLSEKELNQLDDLYKLISPERESDETYVTETPNFNELLSTAAEHLVLLLDGKNKEILGTTYKSLKETILKVHESGYFEPKDDKEETEGSVKDENIQATETALPILSEQLAQPISQEEINSSPSQPVPEIERTASPTQQVSNAYYITGSASVPAPSPNQVIYSNQTSNQQPSNQTTSQSPVEPQAAPLPDVLMQARGSFNFLQESQVDIESPHMDPAVVAAHPMVPPQLNYQVSQNEAALLAVAAAASRSTPSNSTLITPGAPAQQVDYDPARPIPTQTFTNQNFAAMQNMMTAVTPPAGYPTAVAPTPPQATQLQTTGGLMMNQNQPRNISVPSNITETPPGYPPKPSDGFSKPQSRNYSRTIGSHPNPQDITSTTGHYQSSDENEENNEGIQNSYNRNRGNRGGLNKSRGGSGSSNGYGRGPRGGANYSNGRGGSNYYGNRDRNDGFISNRDRTGDAYSNNSANSRRGGANSRGGQRSTGRMNSSGGRGGVYRSQD